MKERKKPEKFLLPLGRPSDDRSFAFSSRVLSKAAKIKALINYGIIRSCGGVAGGRGGPVAVRRSRVGPGRYHCLRAYTYGTTHRNFPAGRDVADHRQCSPD